jgi:hypothetical protein
MAALNPLPRWQRWLLHGMVALLLVSGLAWLALHYSIGAGAGELPHPLEAWLMRLHGAASMGALFAFGGLMPRHVPRGWQMRRQRRTGLALWVFVGLLVGSGYAMYYLVSEALRPGIGLVHAAVGTVLMAGLLWHRQGSRRGQPVQRHHLHPHSGRFRR